MKKTSLGELIANSVSHGIGAILSLTGLIVLLVKADTFVEVSASLVFGLSMFLLYIFSTLFHAFPEKMKRVYNVFQRLDHSAIYLLIAGTYTPFILIAIKSILGYVLLSILWTLAILGIVMKSIWIKKFQKIHLLFYLLMGWSVVLIYRDITSVFNDVLLLLLIGGLFYTIGVGFYIVKFKYQHFIWHLFVLFGSIFHFISVYLIL